jgi:hypothetical protein
MSNAALLKVYDGQDPELAFQSAAPGTSENIDQVLLNTPNPGNAGGNPLTNVGAFSCDSITSVNAGLFTIAGAAGQGVSVVGPVGASLIATTGGLKVEASEGVMELNWDGTGGALNIVPVGAQFDATPIASGKPNWIAAQQLSVQVNGTAYWIPMSTTKFA